jgi:hypothetical protein
MERQDHCDSFGGVALVALSESSAAWRMITGLRRVTSSLR